MYIPHGTAPEHFNPKIANVRPAGAGELHGRSISIRRTSASWGRCSPTSSTSTSTRASSTRAKPTPTTACVNCLSGSTAIDTTTARTTVEHVIAQGAQRQAADPGRLLAHHQRPGHERDAVLERHADRSGEEPGQGVRQPVRRRHHRAARQRGRAAATRICWRSPPSEVQGLQTTLQGLTGEQTKLATHLAAIQSLQADANTMMPASVCSTKPNLPSVEMVRTRSAGNVSSRAAATTTSTTRRTSSCCSRRSWS